MNILITGNGGMLGSNLTDWIIENYPEHIIVGIDNFSGGYMSNVNYKISKQYYMDIQSDTLDKIFTEYQFDVVYHFAAYAAEGLSPYIRKFNYSNNLLSTANIVNACINHDVKRLVFTSSMAVYGHGDPPFNEENTPHPIDPYGVAKFACEMDIQIANEQHGLEYCIIRPHNVYGKKQNIWDKYRNVLGIWMYQKLNNKPITIFGDGEQKRAFSYIDDCLPCLWKAGTLAKAKNQIINLGGTTYNTINEASDILIEVMGDTEKVFLEKRHEVKEAYSTYQKSVILLDYEHKTSLKDGLAVMWNWAKEQKPQQQFIWDNFEIEKGIYKFWKN